MMALSFSKYFKSPWRLDKRRIKANLTLMELLIVLFLLVGMGSLGIFSSITFWRKHQLDQCTHSLTHFLEEVEMLATLTQAQLELAITSSEEGVLVHLKGCTPLALSKGSTTLLLAGIDVIEIDLQEGSLEGGNLIWMTGQRLQPVHIRLISRGISREMNFFLPVIEKRQISAIPCLLNGLEEKKFRKALFLVKDRDASVSYSLVLVKDKEAFS